jgi:hypothetical protein
MSIGWKNHLRDLITARFSLGGTKGRKAAPIARPEAAKGSYQDPKNHPGDEASIRASTELPKEAPSKH